MKKKIGYSLSKFCVKNLFTLNPSDTNVCIDACIPRGDIIISPPAKSIFPVENHVFSPWGEILHRFSFILMYSTCF